MPDEPTKELSDQPQEPRKPNIWDVFNKNRIHAPRDIKSEVEEEFSQGKINTPEQKTLDKKEIVKKFAQGFIDQMAKYNEVTVQEMRKAEYPDEWIQKVIESEKQIMHGHFTGEDFQYLLVQHKQQGQWKPGDMTTIYHDIPPEEQFVKLELIPTLQASEAEEKVESTTSRGKLPIFFEGSDGRRYQAKNVYLLNPYTGEGKKEEEIWPDGDDSWGGNGRITPHMKEINYESNSFESREVDLEPSDYEHLNAILNGIENGIAKPLRMPITPYKKTS